MSDDKNPFDTAKAISDLLKGFSKDRQQSVLRWVGESLGLDVLGTAAQHSGSAVVQPSVQEPSMLAKIGSNTQAVDIKTFVESKQPKTDIQFAAVVAYYYQFEAPAKDQKETINAEVLREATRLASRERLKDPAVTLNNAKKQGYLDSADRGAFAINSVGENLVAMTLPGSGASTPKKTKKKK